MRLLFNLVCLLLGYIGCNADDISVAPLVEGQGYPFEEHEVVTEDGYMLSLHRIPYGKTNPGKIGRPVLIQHGILASSACWLLAGPEMSLGFLMADQGYDVWMPNNRGTTYSMKHRTLDPNKSSDKEKFWNFSFHELGYYDMPASIDYILNMTQQSNLYYIGHSQGTTQFFAMMSSRPEYNEKVVHMSALAPIAFLDHTRGTLKALTYLGSAMQKILNIFHIYNLLDSSPFLRTIEKTFCKMESLTEEVCGNVLFLIAGYDAKQLNESLIPVITKYMPAGASIKELVHFSQLATNGGKFRQYDYGKKQNLIIYSQEEPPEYDLSKISTPVMLHYANNDWLSGIPDVMKLNASLPNSEGLLVPYYYFNHLDFLWAIDILKLVYNNMINIINKY